MAGKSKKVVLAIPLRKGGTWDSEAEVVGDLALHRCRDDPKKWRITHVPSLCHFGKAVPEGLLESGRARILWWMEFVQIDMRMDWAALRELRASDVATNPAESHALRERILEHCRAIKS